MSRGWLGCGWLARIGRYQPPSADRYLDSVDEPKDTALRPLSQTSSRLCQSPSKNSPNSPGFKIRGKTIAGFTALN